MYKYIVYTCFRFLNFLFSWFLFFESYRSSYSYSSSADRKHQLSENSIYRKIENRQPENLLRLPAHYSTYSADSDRSVFHYYIGYLPYTLKLTRLFAKLLDKALCFCLGMNSGPAAEFLEASGLCFALHLTVGLITSGIFFKVQHALRRVFC